jgi:hypothetical protein
VVCKLLDQSKEAEPEKTGDIIINHKTRLGFVQLANLWHNPFKEIILIAVT